MNDNRVGHASHHMIRNHSHQHEPSNELDVLASSESAHIQEFRLYRELSREIEKNSNDRVRYVDSELYQRNQQQSTTDPRYSNPSCSSEVQSATLNIGPPHAGSSKAKVKQSLSSSSSSSSSKTQVQAPSSNRFHANNDELERSSYGTERPTPNGMRQMNQKQIICNSTSDENSKHKAIFLDGNCQVCLIKGLRDDLMHVTRVIQEKNEQLLTELKAKRSRAFSERLGQ